MPTMYTNVGGSWLVYIGSGEQNLKYSINKFYWGKSKMIMSLPWVAF